MKKILCLLLIAASFSYASKIYSKATDDGFNEAIDGVSDKIKELNDEVKDIYSDLNNNQVKAIVDNLETKKVLLKNIQNLSREDDITETNQLHEIELKRELNGLLIDTWSVE
jgi:uncharacterized protein YabN with tetrapyrrole methylase and pyrophosphatase domain